MNLFKWPVGVALSIALVACGGGGGGAGTSVFGGGGSGTGTDGNSTGSVASSTAGAVVVALSSSTISASTPGTVTAQVKKSDGSPIVGTIVTFSVPGSKATITPNSVITDAQGSASAQVVPVSGALGADYVSASADVPNSTALSARTAFTVTSVTTTLGAMSAVPSTLPAYGSSVITVAVTGASAASPVTVNFSSTCASGGKAILSPTNLVVTGGAVAAITYQDQGCASTDRISASIAGTSQRQQADLPISPPSSQSLQFVAAVPATICLAGSGCPDTSIVSFRLLDQNNNPINGQDINFSLDFPSVVKPFLAASKTDANGLASVAISAKTLPTPVRVKAVAGTLSTVSNALAINAGLPTQSSMSFSAATYNVDGWAKDGTESQIRLQLNDRFGNAVPDGTAVSIVAEGASVIPANCLTSSGVCTVKFISSDFRPPDGRVSVTAFAQGEESFIDQNGDNLYTLGEAFTDLGEIFIDRDESGVMNAVGEYIVGDPKNGVWSGNTFVSKGRVFVLSDSASAPRIFNDASGPNPACSASPAFLSLDFAMVALTRCRVEKFFYLRDSNCQADVKGGNPLPAGSTLSVSTKAQGATVSVDNSPISSVITAPTVHKVTVDLADCAQPLTSSGSIDLTVTMPAGQKYTYSIGTITR